MTVEENRESLGVENGNCDKFPVGMRVLAVDDDPTCLKLLDGLLRKCQYHVTTTSQARMALKMLRENRNRFDLVISDVHMPDMDGFKLLELVGLEMDLPVIMLSGNSDTRLVMKGITHGACDYLVKPVRLEELKNIWQHVIRRKKFDSKSQNKHATHEKADQSSGVSGQGPTLTGNSDQNGKVNRKRKDEEEDSEEIGHENEDPGTQKKPRVVWSIELHRKFVAAVNQLGIEKAVPKRILDMMNVEGLTRENVASHLQKYRLYLKRISSVATQQANMVAALGNKDASYMRVGSIDGLGDFRTLAGPGRFANAAGLSSYSTNGILGRLNSPAGMSIRNLNSAALIQPGHAQNVSNTMNPIGKFPPGLSQVHQNSNLFQGIPPSLDLDQLENKCITQTGNFNFLDDPRISPAVNAFLDTQVAVGSSSNPLTCGSSNHLLLPGNPHQAQTVLGFGSQCSLKSNSLHSETFNVGVSGSSNFLDQGRSNDNWQSTAQLSKFPPNSLVVDESFSHDRLPSNGLRDNSSLASPRIENSPLEFSSTSTGPAFLEDTRREIQFQGGLVGDIVQNINQASSQRWDEHKQDYNHNSNNIFSTTNSLIPSHGVVAPLSQEVNEAEKSDLFSKMRTSEDYLLQQTKLQGGFTPNGFDSLNDLIMNSIIKREQNGMTTMDGEFGIDAYSFGSCI